MRFDVVEKRKLLIAIAHHWLGQQIEHELFGYANIAFGGHATHGGRDAQIDLCFEVHGPAVLAERMGAREFVEFIVGLGHYAYRAYSVVHAQSG